MERLYACAVKLHEKGLVELSTYINGKGDYIRVELRIPGRDLFLVSFANLLAMGGLGEISFWSGMKWKELAPDSSSRMDELVGAATSKSGDRHRRLSVLKPSDLPTILVTVHEAYQEVISRSEVD